MCYCAEVRSNMYAFLYPKLFTIPYIWQGKALLSVLRVVHDYFTLHTMDEYLHLPNVQKYHIFTCIASVSVT